MAIHIFLSREILEILSILSLLNILAEMWMPTLLLQENMGESTLACLREEVGMAKSTFLRRDIKSLYHLYNAIWPHRLESRDKNLGPRVWSLETELRF